MEFTQSSFYAYGLSMKFAGDDICNAAEPSRSYIQNGHSALMRLPSGEVKSVKIQANSYVRVAVNVSWLTCIQDYIAGKVWFFPE